MSNSEPMSEAAPLAEYQQRLQAAQSEVAELQGRISLLGTIRWISFVGGLILLWLGKNGSVPAFLVILPIVAFIAAVFVHSRKRRESDRAIRRVELYEQGIDRLNDKWVGVGPSGDRYQDADHVYSGDLDIFGAGSVFQLLCRARTRPGQDQLALWLSAPVEKSIVDERQGAVQELRSEVNLREELSLLDAEVHDEFDQNALREWATSDQVQIGIVARIVATVTSIVGVAGLLGWWKLGWGPTVLVLALVVQLPFLFFFRNKVASVSGQMDKAGKGLEILSQVMQLMEARQFSDPYLARIVEGLKVDGLTPSRNISKLASRVGLLNNSLRNNFFAPIGVLLCLPIHLTHSIEYWRKSVGPHIGGWLTAVGEFETVGSIAGYTYEQTKNVFPTIEAAGSILDVKQVGHPLLPDAECIRNDVTLDEKTRLLLISGSNMSGKSTLLRSVGTSIVLAMAGAPVRAASMRVSCIQMGTAMRMSDSLHEGKSLFFAVLGRLKRVVDLSDHDRPAMFLLDEILQGTNSHDRRIGAEAVIRSLLDRGAVGFVTTHDLALTEIGDTIECARNVHFADQLSDGKMTFDYTLRPGVVQKSNAIELMRLVGLDV